MSYIDNSTETVRKLIELVVDNGLAELEIEQGGLQIKIKGAGVAAAQNHQGSAAALTAAMMQHMTTPAPVAAKAPPVAASAKESRSDLIALESPMVGIFFRSQSPQDPPFVSVGDIVRVGQPIGLIEAMKVYSEVPAEAGGRVVEIAADNGKLVQMGQPLIFLEPL